MAKKRPRKANHEGGSPEKVEDSRQRQEKLPAASSTQTRSEDQAQDRCREEGGSNREHKKNRLRLSPGHPPRLRLLLYLGHRQSEAHALALCDIFVIAMTYFIQKFTYRFMGINAAEFKSKDWFHVEFLALELWLVTWTLLLN